MTVYPCLVMHPNAGRSAAGGPCANNASYFAIDARAKHAHVCRPCWSVMRRVEHELYIGPFIIGSPPGSAAPG